MGPISSKVSHFRRETLHGRFKKRLQPSENDRVLKNVLSSSNPGYFSHSGPQGAESGHYEEVAWSRPGGAPIDSVFYTNMKIVPHGYLLLMEGVTLLEYVST